MSESFIEEFADKVNWINISARQKMSDEFIKKHRNKIDFDFLRRNKNIDYFSRYKFKK